MRARLITAGVHVGSARIAAVVWLRVMLTGHAS